jgi:hypothetical protein
VFNSRCRLHFLARRARICGASIAARTCCAYPRGRPATLHKVAAPHRTEVAGQCDEPKRFDAVVFFALFFALDSLAASSRGRKRSAARKRHQGPCVAPCRTRARSRPAESSHGPSVRPRASDALARGQKNAC